MSRADHRAIPVRPVSLSRNARLMDEVLGLGDLWVYRQLERLGIGGPGQEAPAPEPGASLPSSAVGSRLLLQVLLPLQCTHGEYEAATPEQQRDWAQRLSKLTEPTTFAKDYEEEAEKDWTR